MAELPESMKKLVLNPIRELDKIFGASGLVKIDDIFYVIADDDLSLGIIEPNKEIIFIPLVSGTLPKNYKERKKVKREEKGEGKSKNISKRETDKIKI